MQSVGEVMSIASTFTESLTKAIRSLEIGKSGIRNIDNRFIGMPKRFYKMKSEHLGLEEYLQFLKQLEETGHFKT